MDNLCFVKYGLRHKETLEPVRIELNVNYREHNEPKYTLRHNSFVPDDSSNDDHPVWFNNDLIYVLIVKTILKKWNYSELPTVYGATTNFPDVSYISREEYEVVAYHCYGDIIAVPTTDGVPQTLEEIMPMKYIYKTYIGVNPVSVIQLKEAYDYIEKNGRYPQPIELSHRQIDKFASSLMRGLSSTGLKKCMVKFDFNLIKHEFLKLMVGLQSGDVEVL